MWIPGCRKPAHELNNPDHCEPADPDQAALPPSLSPTSCTSGCKCGDKDIDAHHTDHVSQTYLSSLRVSQHPNCTVTITISNRTSSGEHKFKMIAIMVSDVAGRDPSELRVRTASLCPPVEI